VYIRIMYIQYINDLKDRDIIYLVCGHEEWGYRDRYIYIRMYIYIYICIYIHVCMYLNSCAYIRVIIKDRDINYLVCSHEEWGYRDRDIFPPSSFLL
jgi:hypothetical protein